MHAKHIKKLRKIVFSESESEEVQIEKTLVENKQLVNKDCQNSLVLTEMPNRGYRGGSFRGRGSLSRGNHSGNQQNMQLNSANNNNGFQYMPRRDQFLDYVQFYAAHTRQDPQLLMANFSQRASNFAQNRYGPGPSQNGIQSEPVMNQPGHQQPPVDLNQGGPHPTNRQGHQPTQTQRQTERPANLQFTGDETRQNENRKAKRPKKRQNVQNDLISLQQANRQLNEQSLSLSGEVSNPPNALNFLSDDIIAQNLSVWWLPAEENSWFRADQMMLVKIILHNLILEHNAKPENKDYVILHEAVVDIQFRAGAVMITVCDLNTYAWLLDVQSLPHKFDMNVKFVTKKHSEILNTKLCNAVRITVSDHHQTLSVWAAVLTKCHEPPFDVKTVKMIQNSAEKVKIMGKPHTAFDVILQESDAKTFREAAAGSPRKFNAKIGDTTHWVMVQLAIASFDLHKLDKNNIEYIANEMQLKVDERRSFGRQSNFILEEFASVDKLFKIFDCFSVTCDQMETEDTLLNSDEEVKTVTATTSAQKTEHTPKSQSKKSSQAKK